MFAERDHADLVADLDVEALSARCVDHEVGLPPRRTAFSDGEGAGLVRPRRTDGRRAESAQCLALRVDQRHQSCNGSDGGLDLVQRGDLVDQSLGKAFGEREGREFVGDVARDLGVDSSKGLGEQIGEDPVERIGEDVAPGDQTRAEHDRQHGERQPQLVTEEPFQGRPEHQTSSVLILSRTASAVGEAMSSTMRPSSRNTARSAYPAAIGSWVTITIV